MNILRNYSRLSRASYRTIRTFSFTGQSSFASSKFSKNSNPDSRPVKKDPDFTTQNQPKPQDPQHLTSTDPNFSNFNPPNPQSASSSPGTESDLTSSAKDFTDRAAYNVKDFADTAADSARNFVNNTTTSRSAREFTNSAASAAQELIYAAADTANSTAKGLSDTADSIAASFVPNYQSPFRSRPSASESNYSQPNNQYSASAMPDFLGSTLKGIGDVAAGVASVASAFIPGVQTILPRDSYSDRHRYTSTDRMIDNERGMNSPFEAVGAAVKGFTDLAGSVASTLIPTGQNSGYRSPFPSSSGTNIAESLINNAVQGVTDVTRGISTVASTVASNFIPGFQNLVPGATSDKKASTEPASVNQDFIYTGSQVEDLTFTDANKKGEVSSGDATEDTLETVRNIASTASAAVQDAADMVYWTAQSFANSAGKGVISSTTDFAIATGSAALSAATSAVRRFNAVASGASSSSNDEGFVYTGTQINEDLTFSPLENQSIETDAKKQTPTGHLYDVVISGASINGSALACALGHYKHFDRENKKILLLDPKEPPSLQEFQDKSTVPDQRVIALSHSSVNFLKELGVWSLLNRDRIGSIRQMQIWELGGNSFVKFNENTSKGIGNVVESIHLQAALYERLRALDNVKLEVLNKITDIKNESKGFATVSLDDEAKVSARLVVGSDGLNSVVKKKAKIASTGWNSPQHGIVCTVKTHYPNSTAWQRFLNTGPIAMLPLWDEYSAVIWSCEADLHQSLMQASDEDFLKEVNYNFSRKSQVNTPNLVLSPNAGFDIPPSVIELSNKRRSFPVSMQQANQYVGDRVALIGECAHSIHPLAGQGLNMGLTDAAYLANVIIKNLKAGNDIGNKELLREYETASMNLNTAMLYSMELVKRSYESNTYSPLVFARNLAVSAVNNFAPVKSIFIDIGNGKYFQPTDYEWKKVI